MLPLSTTTITVERSGQDGTQDDIDGVTFSTVAAGVRAHIGNVGGVESNAGGSSEATNARLDCDPIDLAHGDRITDDATCDTWQVEWVRLRTGLGLDHIEAGLARITDRAGI